LRELEQAGYERFDLELRPLPRARARPDGPHPPWSTSWRDYSGEAGRRGDRAELPTQEPEELSEPPGAPQRRGICSLSSTLGGQRLQRRRSRDARTPASPPPVDHHSLGGVRLSRLHDPARRLGRRQTTTRGV
jgi:hypothetical protein